MNKKTKWGIIILVGAGIIGGGIYSQLPKKNDELVAADKVMGKRPTVTGTTTTTGFTTETGRRPCFPSGRPAETGCSQQGSLRTS